MRTKHKRMPMFAMPDVVQKKTPSTQLEREINEALSRHRSRKSPHRHHATKAEDGEQEQAEVLMVANDAALEGDFALAAKILKGGRPRLLKVYTAVREPDVDDNDFVRVPKGDRKVEIDVTAADIKKHGQEDKPVTEALVKKVAAMLSYDGKQGDEGLQASSDTWDGDVWYYTMAADPYTGALTEKSYFLENFTQEESQRIFEETRR